MKSSNPHSGVYKAETARTLDLNGGSPACHQGGIAIVHPIEGNGARPSHQGPGFGEADDPSYTLNAVERHGVAECAAVDCRNGTEDPNTNGTLQAKSNGGISLNLNNVVRTWGGSGRSAQT